MGLTCQVCDHHLYTSSVGIVACPNYLCRNFGKEVKELTMNRCPSCQGLFRPGVSHDCPPGTRIPVSEIPKDVINPDHYKAGGIEAIDYMKAKMSPEAFEGYLQGNVIKYVSRYKLKNGIEDLKKANWYLNRLISMYDRPEG